MKVCGMGLGGMVSDSRIRCIVVDEKGLEMSPVE
jgi:hypothetical protein